MNAVNVVESINKLNDEIDSTKLSFPKLNDVEVRDLIIVKLQAELKGGSTLIKRCKCGGEAIVEDGFIHEINSSGKFVCCLECPNKTKVYLDHEETKALDDWVNNILLK